MATCKLCGAPHSACRGAAGALVTIPLARVEGKALVALHTYNVPNGSRRNPGTAQIQLSDEDAERLGLTAKDRVSSDDQTVQGAGSTFEPTTEAELAGVPVTAAPTSTRTTRTRAATSGRRSAAKQAKAPKNKSAAPAADKDGAAPAAAAPAAGDGGSGA